MKLSARDRRHLAAIDEVYRMLPSVACRGLCAEACGPIVLTDLEARRLHQTTHAKPRTLPVVRGDGRDQERCVYLDDRNRCRAYAVRPLICRVYGVVKMLSCPHGCTPDRWLDNLEFVRLAKAIERVGGGRVLRTCVEGLGHVEGESFSALPPATRSVEQMAVDAERTRSLRAVFGGRIIAAIEDR